MSRVRLAVELTLIGPVLTHGSGAGRLGVDATVATLPDGRCYLPFSLIKGRLRQSWDELDFAEAEEWFGSRVGGWSATRGRFRFTDLIETRAAKRVGMPTRHRICIDEETGAADDGMLQVLENPFAAGERVVFKGEITFFGSDANAEMIREQLLSAFQWTSGFGAGRTIGFGRVHEAQVSIVSEGKEQTPGTLEGSDFDYAITLRDPFCLARRRIAENLFETDEVIPGAAIRGVAATTLNDLLGRRSSDNIDGHAVIDPQWSALARHFNTITISHAFPSNDARPVEPPISLVKYSDEKLVDIALQNGPGLIDGQAPEFFIDWKGDTHGNLRKRYLWPDLGAQKEIRVRTAIDRGTRRAKEKHLFSYEMIRPGETVWRGSVSFAKVPAEERLAVIAQFQKLFALEPAAWGKSKARGRLTLIRTAQPPEAARFAETPWVVTLQTPALLCDPATLNEASGRDELFDAYAAAWDDLSDHSLRLVRFFAQQSLAGGYLIHRFRPGRQYAPFLLTNPGSVFVLEPVKPEGQASIETFARERLPLPQWAKDRYTEHWQSNPFLPADGFGEVVVNLPCHREPVPGFTPIETETWEQVATAPTEEIAARVAAANRGSVAPRKEDTSIGKNDPAKFSKRWKISATLRTTSDLHIGTGERLTNRLARIDREKKSQKVEVSAIATDHRNRAYLPGSGLKGALRSWLLEQFPDEVTTIKGVFGAGGDATTSRGGKVEVHDAHASEEQPDAFAPVPHWEVARLTGVTASAAIDRRTRTARDEKLFHREYVPVGITFEVSLSGDELDEVEVALLVRALQGFNDTSPIQLGAETREGWGRFQCDAIEVQSTDVALWLDKKPWTSSTEAIRTLASRRTPDALGNQLHIPLTIAFTGPFLVNEPSRTKRPGEENDLPNHAERVGVDEKVVLPVSSFRGALRSRAEKIVRTLGKKACAATDPGDACKAIESAKEVATLCLTCQLFGAPGWATPIDYEGFRLTHEPDPYKQELVAIDRFTGGVSGTAKFNVKAVWRPEFESAMTVNLSRWSTAKMSAETRDAALGLLLLTLRDLADGDMTLGFGASKGYGAC
ncbi:MAG: RAMP superfamily CRISPR-associated protein, partial [Acidobacteriota bacterium]